MNDFIPAPNLDPYQMLMSTEKILLRLPFLMIINVLVHT